MKYILFFTILMGYSTTNQDPDLSVIRALYLKAAEQESAGKRLLKMTENFVVQNPVLFAYKGAGHMMMAKHVIDPFSKLYHFNKGKKIFNAAIIEDPDNPELRFLRFSVQAEAPGFLGYKENIEEDKEILMQEIGNIQDRELQKMISDYFLSSKAVNNSERQRIKENIN